MRDFGTKIDNSAPSASGVLTADEDNVRFREDENVVSTSGIALDAAAGPDTDLKMKAQAIARYASGGVFYSDAGAANAYILASPSGVDGFVMPKAYFDGMEIEFTPANSNTGASTVDVNGLGAKTLLRTNGDPLEANDLVDAVPTVARYSSSDDAFFINPWALKEAAEVSGTTGSYLNNPVYPDVTTNDGLLLLSNPSAGNLEIQDGGRFIHRGWKEYLTTDFAIATRQFTTAANKTYHLRWTPSEGFSLEDLSNGTYNPSSSSETDTAFDTDYDDMLITRVVTDGSNNITITNLINKSSLAAEINKTTSSLSSSSWSVAFTPTTSTINWSRQPVTSFSYANCEISSGHDMITVMNSSADRYTATAYAYGYNLALSTNYNNGKFRLELTA